MPNGDGAECLLQIDGGVAANPCRSSGQQEAQGRRSPPSDDHLAMGAGEGAAVAAADRNGSASRGGVISAVDIIHGLGVYAGLERIDVPGITGFLDTNYIGKGEYGVRSLEKNDFVFIHVEAIDEAGHMGDVERKFRRWKISTKKLSARC